MRAHRRREVYASAGLDQWSRRVVSGGNTRCAQPVGHDSGAGARGDKPVEAAEVLVAGATHQTNASGVVVITGAAGDVELTVVKSGYVPASAKVHVSAGAQQNVDVDLQPEC